MFRMILILGLLFVFGAPSFAAEEPAINKVADVEKTGKLVIALNDGVTRFFLQSDDAKIRLFFKKVKLGDYKDGDKVKVFGHMKHRGKRTIFIVTKIELQK